LHEHLVVEDEAIVVLLERQRLQESARERAEARMVLGELLPDEQILDEGQNSVRDILVERHAALERAPPQDSRAQRDVVEPARDAGAERRNEARRVLVIRVDHHHDVRTTRERLGVASLLVAAVTTVGLVNDGGKP